MTNQFELNLVLCLITGTKGVESQGTAEGKLRGFWAQEKWKEVRALYLDQNPYSSIMGCSYCYHEGTSSECVGLYSFAKCIIEPEPPMM